MENILISNPEELQRKIEKFKKDGFENLHLLSDFDRSFTKCFVDGKISSTSWAQFRNLGIFDEDYLKKTSQMYEYYRPIEISSEISEEERQEKMKEWWEKHLALLVEKGVSKSILQDVMGRGGITLREGAKEILEFLNENNIPLIFVSSGLGDIIAGFLEKEGMLFGNIYIASNFFNFDSNGKAISFRGDLIINSHNKNEASLKNLEFFDKIKDRKNIILVGDAIEDLKILDGAIYDETIKFGFLNEEVEKNLELFRESFDVVITGDGDMNYLLKMLKGIKDQSWKR